MNRLGREKSPYLLQHAANPVDWHAWGAEAFEKARKEDKMIFLSIGYSTCHWCHVMERESFENPEVADLLNKDFVAVKVDREERPDIDHIYMAAIQAMTGSGGWPLTAFLTPVGHPVTGGTYFPPEDRWGRPGMKTILPRIAGLWREKRGEVEKAGAHFSELLSRVPKNSNAMPEESLLAKAFEQFSGNFDPDNGGFGGAPKFPRSHELSFLLRYWKRTQDHSALEMTEVTLDKMARGGMADQLGGGFHRYSTDERWLIPHFEKMLYDQALLAVTYLEAYQAVRKPVYAETARNIFQYVLRDMQNPEGGFYSAEDADSEGEEGKFYAWQPEEIVRLLGAENGKIVNDFYGVTDQGNFEQASSVLHIPQTPEAFAGVRGLEISSLNKIISAGLKTLFTARGGRIPPYKDDKILTAWNGLMISALALGARVLNAPDYAAAAEKAAGFILSRLQKNDRLLRRFREGESAVPAFQDDYAYFAYGLLELYEATLNVRWFEEAKRLTDQMLQFFWDAADGGFFYTAEDGEKLITRPKEYYDGAVPSGNSQAALLLLKLSRMTGNPDYEEKARQVILSNAAPLNEHPIAFPQLLSALDFALAPGREIVIAGESAAPDFQTMKELLFLRFAPYDVWLHRPSGKEGERMIALAPFVENQKPLHGKTAVYICRNRQCELPISEAGEMRKQLAR